MGSWSSTFGQTYLRVKPHFYLFTRFLIMQRSSAAVHTFRVKHSIAANESGLLYGKESQEDFHRPDTAGYIYYLMNHMYTRCGKLRGNSIAEDVEMIQKFEEQYKNVLVIAYEPEQRLLANWL